MKIKDITKTYEGDGVTIYWRPAKCIHSEKCWRNLPEVFRYKQKPWVDPTGASADRIKPQIDQCPSGALSYEAEAEDAGDQLKLTAVKGGPLLVAGSGTVDYNGESIDISVKSAFCRCGASNNKPFCDGSHHKVDFE